MAKSRHLESVTVSPGKPPVFHVLSRAEWKCAALVIAIVESSKDRFASESFPPDIAAAINKTIELHGFEGKVGTLMQANGIGSAERLILLGVGKPEKINADQIRWAGSLLARHLRKIKINSATFHPAGVERMNWPILAGAFAEGVSLGDFRFTAYKSEKKSPSPQEEAGKSRPLTLSICCPDQNSVKTVQRVLAEKSVITAATNLARKVACQPGNVLTPSTLTGIARNIAAANKLKFSVINSKTAQKMGMGGLCAVGAGSASPPALLILEYLPRGIKSNAGKTVAVVGKAVTFDTGGISIKPAADMGNMKYDKCGGMAVLGIMQAAAQLKLPHHVVGLIPTAENTLDSQAYRPGDILHMYNGKTVDVTNTDAEGRLILADAIAYACEKYKPGALIEMSTLTGGVVVALGSVFAGLMAGDDELAAQLIAAGTSTGERLWRLPLDPAYRKLLDSPHADMVNSGAREAHPIQGGMFLSEFVADGVPWAHLDIAGVAHPKKDDRWWIGDHASGFGVRLVVEYIQNLGA
ncbi:MAG: leucyl aminopeptidase family protein [Phycisphaerae bacterium]